MKRHMRLGKYIPNFFLVSISLVLLASFMLLISELCPPFADFLNSTVGQVLRAVLALITYIFPFSVFELVLFFALPFLFFVVAYAVRLSDRVKRVRFLLTVISVLSFLFTSFVFTLGVGYRASPLGERLGLDEVTVDGSTLFSTASIVQEELNRLAEDLELRDGATDMPYNLYELSCELVSAYDTVRSEYGTPTSFPSRVKPVTFSGVMADAGITGIYSYFTGEANISTAYTDFSLPFTAAHELAHQRGIARENEANFTAFLVCISSDELYIQYSGYLNLYMYLSSALYNTDRDAYLELEGKLSDVARADRERYYEVVREHSDSLLNRIMDRVNDVYLKANGTEGIVSYGLVVRLAVAYYSQ